MNLFFWKIKTKNYIGLLLILFSSVSMQAGDSIPDKDFEKICKNADAYFLYSYTDVTYEKLWGSYKRHISITNKLVVNNSTGVDNFAYLNLPEYISNHIKKIEVKTLKADGSFVALDSSLVFKKKANSKSRKIGAIHYPIPGVEPGDTIATSYVYTEYLKKHELMAFVNLINEIPSINTEYSIRTNQDLIVRYKGYNKFPEPKVISNDSLIYCLFKKEKIKGIKSNEHSCVSCELPYLYYSLEKKEAEPRTWKDVYNQEFNVITQPILFDFQKSSYYSRWKRRVISEAKDSSKYHKLTLLLQDIQDNIQMEEIKESEIIKSSGFFLKEKRINPHSIKRLYRQILEDLEIQYWAVFARNKSAGKIDQYYIRKGEFDHVFFGYNDDKGIFNILFPHKENYKFQLNEIPTSIYNTEAVIVKPYLNKKLKKKDKFINYDFKLAEVDSVTMKIIKLPGGNVNRNSIKQTIYGMVNLENEAMPIKYRLSVSGGMYSDLKSFFTLLDQDNEVSEFYDALEELEGKEDIIQVDSVMKTVFKAEKPSFTMNSVGTLNGALTFLNDSIASISLDKLIKHSQIETIEDKADLNYYLDYSYTDFFMFMLEFPYDIDVLGIEGYNLDFKNEFGAYMFDLKKINNNIVSIQSNYKIIKDMIPKEEYGQLKKLNQLVQEIKNKRLIVKLKKH